MVRKNLKTIKISLILIIIFLQIPVKANPLFNRINYYNNQGIKNLKRNNAKEALKNFTKALAKNPHSGEILYNLGNTFYKTDDLDKALESYNQALNRLDRNKKANVYFNIGNSYILQQKYDKAIENYIKSLVINPKDIEAKINLEIALKMKEEQTPTSNNTHNKNQKKQKTDNKDQAEQALKETMPILNALEENEKQARKKLIKIKSNQESWIDKDW